MPESVQGQDSATLKEYKERLRDDWTRPVACQNQCSPIDSCCCQRYIVHVDAVQRWLLRKISQATGHTNLHRLLDEIPTDDLRIFPLKLNYKSLFTGEHSCLRVFSLLLQQDRGHLVDRFYDSDINDKYLSIMRTDSNQSLRDKLSHIKQPGEVDRILDEFHEGKWAYCPLELTLRMSRNLHGTKVIPPFCHKTKLGDKGGTASIYWVAIQKDFITDEPLKNAIADSLYEDPDYGQCYQMVLKSYCGNKKSVYDLEREAFSALSQNEDVPIVRYLGCYEHDYGEGSRNGKTYNLLLECGECDLFQAWADDTNVPPVRAEEIISVWKSLFGVAEAIQHVHNLEVPWHGKSQPLRYVGWHADIKPDNILVVRKRLKLADFGYSRFAPVAERQHGSTLTELIEGFTDTYGAPEVFRMKQPDGTMTGVTQSIDTWSFGCVLSVAATWVVLGFQGIRQFERLRQLAPSNKREGKTYDRFHDGIEVLPEIRKWHNYLRGHLRPSDTTTPLVLNLVENDMFQTDPRNRIELGDLCVELRKILGRARNEIEDLKTHSRKTEPVVLQALLSIEEKAHEEKSNRRKTTPVTQQTITTSGIANLNPAQRATMKVDKGRLYESKPLGQTPYRMEILKKDLKVNTVIEQNKSDMEHATKDKHNGDFTDSPTHTQLPADAFIRKVKPRKPDHHSPNGLDQPMRQFDGSAENFGDERLHEQSLERQTDDPTADAQIAADSASRYVDRLGGEVRSSVVQPLQKYPETNARPQLMFNSESSNHYSPQLPQSTASPVIDRASVVALPEASTQFPSIEHSTTSPREILPGPHTSSHFKNDHEHLWGSSSVPRLETPSRNHPGFGDDRTYEPRYEGGQPFSGLPVQHPNILISHPSQAQHSGPLRKERPQRRFTSDKQAVHDEDRHEILPGQFVRSLPSSALELPYNVCDVRREIESESPKGKRATLKGFLRFEERKADKGLAKTYGDGREIIFVIDNGATNFRHWPIMVFVAETLVKKAAGLDKNGVDLVFTVDGKNHNKSGLKRDQGRRQFRAALDAAAPDNAGNNGNQTDMNMVLSEIVRDWRNAGRRPTTLIILTDGLWPNTLQNLVDDTILSVAGEPTSSKVGNRPFSIQFIRFGEEGKSRLDMLDNNLCLDRGLRDIVDHCSWRSTVEKMFKGSIDGQYDQLDPDETIFDDAMYPQLAKLFHDFNNDISQDVASPANSGLFPPVPTHASLSRSSSNSSTGRNKRQSTPAQRTESWKSHNRNTFSA